jgi:hypothetical protein
LWLVGATGFEPVTSSVSEGSGAFEEQRDASSCFLAERTPHSFDYTKVSTQPSHPRDSIFFQAGVEGCEQCVTFIGDYIGLDYGRDGKANMAWTDMRQFRTIEDVSGYAQYIFYARR